MIRLIKRMKLRGQQGFTLVEILLAVSVLGIVGASIMSGLNVSSRTITTIREITTAESLTRTQTEYIRRCEYDYRKAETTLSDNIDDPTQNYVPVVSTADFLPSGVICIEEELIQYTYKTSTQFCNCTRGVMGTSVTDHDKNDRVVHDPYPSDDDPPDGCPGNPIYIVDPGIDLAGGPYYGDYSIEVVAVRLDPENELPDVDDDDGIQKITIEIYYQGRLVLSTDTYKAYR